MKKTKIAVLGVLCALMALSVQAQPRRNGGG